MALASAPALAQTGISESGTVGAGTVGAGTVESGTSGSGTVARTLRVVAPWDLRGLDPARGGFVFQRLSVADTLVATDREGRFLPSVADMWSVAPDGLTWRFRIGTSRRFHDGSPVTPGSVVNALTIARAATGNALRRVPITAIASDDAEVVIHLSGPFSILPAYLASASALILAPDAYGPDGRVRTMIGSGPYRVTKIDGAFVVETTATDAGPAIRRVQYRAVPDGETRARLAEAGDAELAFNLPPAAADRLRRGRHVEVAAVPIPRARYVALNVGLPLFADLRVRQALSFAIDRVGAARVILRNPAAAADQLLPPFLADWRDPATLPLRTDRAAAEALLDAAGWKPASGGVRTKDGTRLSFELFTYAARPELPVLAEAMQANWRDLGIEARIRLGDSEEIPQLRASGKLESALVARGYAQVPDPVGTLTDDFVTPVAAGWASAGWRSASLEVAIQTYRSSRDPVEQAAARYRITDILQRELPVIPHSWYDQVVAFSRALDGRFIDPYERTYAIADLRWAAA